jgi:hypothetical protein
MKRNFEINLKFVLIINVHYEKGRKTRKILIYANYEVKNV